MSADFSTQAGLASFAGTELQRRRQLARMSRPELIDAVIAAEGLVTSVPTEHEVGRRQVSPDSEIPTVQGVG